MTSYFVYGFATLLIQFITDFYSYCMIICLFGIFDGLFLSSLLPMAYETAESKKLVNQALGYYNTLISFTMIAGPSISGVLFEIFKDYYLAYDIAAGLSLFAGMILLVYPKTGIHHLISFFKTKISKSKSVYDVNNLK